MKKQSLLLIIVLLLSLTSFPQVSINNDGADPDNSAILDVKSTAKGMLIPRMTATQIGAIVNPANGLQVYNTDNGKIYLFVSSDNVWKELSYGTGTITPPFVCGNPIIYEGKSYTTVLIGTQCWFAQNLNIGTKVNGSGEQINNSEIEKYCYSDLESNCDVYGGLYQWAEMVQYLNGATNTTSWSPVPTGNVQGICPAGWHLPSNAEWTQIATFLAGASVAGGKMKEAGTSHWSDPNTGATNSSGFSGLPGGACFTSGYFTNIGTYGYWRSTTETGTNMALFQLMSFDNSDISSYDNNKSIGFSTRCIKD